jgi:hypothetical protein
MNPGHLNENTLSIHSLRTGILCSLTEKAQSRSSRNTLKFVLSKLTLTLLIHTAHLDQCRQVEQAFSLHLTSSGGRKLPHILKKKLCSIDY